MSKPKPTPKDTRPPGARLHRPGYVLSYVVAVSSQQDGNPRKFTTWADVCGFVHNALADGYLIHGITVQYEQVTK